MTGEKVKKLVPTPMPVIEVGDRVDTRVLDGGRWSLSGDVEGADVRQVVADRYDGLPEIRIANPGEKDPRFDYGVHPDAITKIERNEASYGWFGSYSWMTIWERGDQRHLENPKPKFKLGDEIAWREHKVIAGEGKVVEFSCGSMWAQRVGSQHKTLVDPAYAWRIADEPPVDQLQATVVVNHKEYDALVEHCSGLLREAVISSDYVNKGDVFMGVDVAADLSSEDKEEDPQAWLTMSVYREGEIGRADTTWKAVWVSFRDFCEPSERDLLARLLPLLTIAETPEHAAHKLLAESALRSPTVIFGEDLEMRVGWTDSVRLSAEQFYQKNPDSWFLDVELWSEDEA